MSERIFNRPSLQAARDLYDTQGASRPDPCIAYNTLLIATQLAQISAQLGHAINAIEDLTTAVSGRRGGER